LRIEDMTADQREQLAVMFTNEFMPTLQKWCAAYEGHVRVKPGDVRLNQFKQRLGFEGRSCLYTFVTDDGTTIDFQEQDGKARMFYMMTSGAAHELNEIPNGGTQPDLSVPITPKEIVKMAEADTGGHFSTNQILVRPTGAACSMQGGAFVSVGGRADQWDATNVSLVFGRDGILVNYNGPVK